MARLNLFSALWLTHSTEYKYSRCTSKPVTSNWLVPNKTLIDILISRTVVYCFLAVKKSSQSTYCPVDLGRNSIIGSE